MKKRRAGRFFAILFLVSAFLVLGSGLVLSDHYHAGSCNTCGSPYEPESSLDCTFIDAPADGHLDGGLIDDNTLGVGGWHRIDTAAGYEVWYKLRNDQPGQTVFDLGTVSVTSYPAGPPWKEFNKLFSETEYAFTARARPGPCPSSEYWWTKDTGVWGFDNGGDYGGWLKLKTPDAPAADFGDAAPVSNLIFEGQPNPVVQRCTVQLYPNAFHSAGTVPLWGNFFEVGTGEWQVEYDDHKGGTDLDYGFRYKSNMAGDQFQPYVLIMRRDAGDQSYIGVRTTTTTPKCGLKEIAPGGIVPVLTDDITEIPKSDANPGKDLYANVYDVEFCGDSEATTYWMIPEQAWVTEECDPPGTTVGCPAGKKCGSQCVCVTQCEDKDGDTIGGTPYDPTTCPDCDDNPANTAKGGGKLTRPDAADDTCNGIDNDCSGKVDDGYVAKTTCGGTNCEGLPGCYVDGKSTVTGGGVPCSDCGGTLSCTDSRSSGCIASPSEAVKPCLSNPGGVIIYNAAPASAADCGLCCRCANGNIEQPTVKFNSENDCSATLCPDWAWCGLGSCADTIWGKYPVSMANTCSELTPYIGPKVAACSANPCVVDCSNDADGSGSDDDGDGYSCGTDGYECGDCKGAPGLTCDQAGALGNSIHPGGNDANCNGIDEDCDGTPDDSYTSIGCTPCAVPGCCFTSCNTGVVACGLVANTWWKVPPQLGC